MKYFYTYKTTLLKGKLKNYYYFGQHTTSDLNDSYCGSGVLIRDYMKKYGAKKNVTYKKEIIQFYNNLDDLNKAEAELIGDKYKTDPMCLNLIAGGNQCGVSIETQQKLKEKRKGRKPALGHKCSEEHKQKIREKNLGHKNYMHHQPEEARQKIKEKNTGENNGNYGIHWCWIHLNNINKKVYPEYLNYWLDDGWELGQKHKNK